MSGCVLPDGHPCVLPAQYEHVHRRDAAVLETNGKGPFTDCNVDCPSIPVGACCLNGEGPRSRSRSLESRIRSPDSCDSRNCPLCRSIWSTSVVLPWSTWAIMATLRILVFFTFDLSSRVAAGHHPVAAADELARFAARKSHPVRRASRSTRHTGRAILVIGAWFVYVFLAGNSGTRPSMTAILGKAIGLGPRRRESHQSPSVGRTPVQACSVPLFSCPT